MFEIARRVVPAGSVSEDEAAWADLETTVVLVLADGAGGMGGGASAARLAVQLALEAATQIEVRASGAWAQALLLIDDRLVQDRDAGETTLVVAAYWGTGAAGASVGDSGAWLIPDGQIAPAVLTAEQRRKPLLGSGAAVPIPFQIVTPPGVLLLASDGLLNYLRHELLVQTVREDCGEDAADRLIQAVRLRSGALHDDVSVLLCRWSPH